METSLLAGWENFYVLVGTTAGGLTGLTFVVIALVKDRNTSGIRPAGISVFVTPTIVHFAGVLAFRNARDIAVWMTLRPPNGTN
jgi:hypothetical protein